MTPQSKKPVLDEKDLKHILKLKPQDRSLDQIQIIKTHVKDIKVFKEFNQQSNEEQLNELCRNLQLQFLPENKILFEQGDRGDSYFIILDGSVDISIKVVDDKNGVEYNKKVAVLKKGDAFGDLSLLYGAPRNASCQTREDSYFIVMNKSIYDKVIKSHQVEKIHEIAQFYLNFPLFQNLDKITLMYFATKTIPQKLQSKQVVVKQGDDPGRVYFVKSGRLKIIKKVNFRIIPENGYLQFDELIEDPIITEIRHGQVENKLLQLDILEQGDVFCHNSVIQHQIIEYTVITEVPCEVYIINEMDFLTLNKYTLDQFQEYIKPYPTDKDLRKMHYESIRWKNYKNNIMEIIKLNKARKSSFSSLLRGSQAPMPKMLDQDYLNMNDKTLVYHKNFKIHKENTNNNSQVLGNTQQTPSIQPHNFKEQLSLQPISEKIFEVNNESNLFSVKQQNKALFKIKDDSLKSQLKLQPIKVNNNSSLYSSGLNTQRDKSIKLFGSYKKPDPVFEVEQKKNQTIYKFESKDQQYQIIHNTRNIFSNGALPPLTLRVVRKSQSTARL
ncbi:cyclic nucleotide-binding domain containing protein [Stylonychia lemnae]|uniref:Cyclic nucleotide-binding domain containing protein n=1 Tax=Stylonychia lemnae TaxID=5949 RepID=A0A078B6V5_STYLE|nr:cyclic nucleotide-binding domain containing protein [Stylonychia lemnae]|eukprot:CDW90270.1 cyclic nucleotide-binding domain containing protein [Stylonychia lemnae]